MSNNPTSEQFVRFVEDSERLTVADPEYQKGHGDREGGLERMAIVAMTPGDGFAALES